MTVQQKIESVLRQIAALPEIAQEELVHELVEMQAELSGLYQPDDDERIVVAGDTLKP